MMINFAICVLVTVSGVKCGVNDKGVQELRADFLREHEHRMPTVGHHPYTNPWLLDENESEAPFYPVQHAGLPQSLAVVPMPLQDSDHELMFNVTWQPSLSAPARDYSIEVRSLTETIDCQTPMCYDYNIPGDSVWWTIPAFSNPVAETCAVRPGCTYRVRLIAHPWDGHTSANLDVQLDECVAGVCSCAHAPRLPQPIVKAKTVSIMGDVFVNVSWALPPPPYPQRLPPGLKKKSYFVSIGKQMVSNAHHAPWFANTISRKVDADGTVFEGDRQRWLLLPISERGGERGGERRDKRLRNLVLDVRLLARVNLIDEWGCIGPAGNVTAYDPSDTNENKSVSVGTYLLWATFGGICVLAMVAILAISTRVVKRVLNAFRPTAAAPLDPLRHRPAWFSLQLRKDTNAVVRGQMEESPLYTQKTIVAEEEGDEWEVSRSRVRLGALIGSGAFGRVHAAQLDLPSGESITVAAKMLTEDASEEEMQDFLREIVMLKHVGSHKHVTRLIGCCTKKAPLIALLEHAPRGDLLTLLRAARGKRKEGKDTHGSSVEKQVDSDVQGRPSEADTEYTNLSDSDPALYDVKQHSNGDLHRSKDHYVAEPALQLDGSTMRDYALQVALGMKHLEERGITHRDLAARNILVDAAGILKVADFGLSRSGVYVHTRSRPVPLRWLAPEAIIHSQYCSASDVWAFAVLLWEIATLGGFPYAELSNHQVPSFLSGGGRLPKPARASPRLYQLMVECWADEPQDRPTFAQIVDKLNAQKQLYVDLECIFPPTEDEEYLSDYDFNMSDYG